MRQNKDSLELNAENQVHRDLTKLEKNHLGFSLKGLIGTKRTAWRALLEEMRFQRHRYARYTNRNPIKMAGNRKQKAIDPDDPEIIEKAKDVANRIRLVNFAMLKIEREITEAV